MITIDTNDWLLEHLVTSVNGTDKEIEVTVLTDGMLVSGKLVSGHKYLNYVKSELTFDEKLSDTADLRNYKLKATIDGTIESIIEDRDRLSATTSYYHMVDAKFHKRSGKGLAGQKGTLWRGFIDRVSGFYLGS